MNAPKLKGLTIVDQIKERVGQTNFIDVSDMSQTSQLMSVEELIRDQESQIEAFKKSVSWAEESLKTETKEEEIEKLIASIIFNTEMIDNYNSYINHLKNDSGQ